MSKREQNSGLVVMVCIFIILPFIMFVFGPKMVAHENVTESYVEIVNDDIHEESDEDVGIIEKFVNVAEYVFAMEYYRNASNEFSNTVDNAFYASMNK